MSEKTYRTYYETTFRDGAKVTTTGTCASEAGARALRIRDQELGNRSAIIEKIEFAFEVET